MTSAPVKIGIDDRGRFFYVARVRQEIERPRVEALARFERSMVQNHPILDEGDLLFAVSDELVKVSELHAVGQGPTPPAQLARFEQIQSLLDDETEFLLDTLPVGLYGERSLGLAVRRVCLDEVIRPFTASLGDAPAKARFALRAEALAQGYLSFAQAGPGEFICLMDFNDRLITICFVYQKRLIGVAHLVTVSFDLTTPAGFEQMTIELKTLVNFKLTAFSQQNVRVPLSAVILSGGSDEGQALEILKKYFPVHLSRVSMSSGFFAQPDKVAQIPAGEYLVSLGLTSLVGNRFQ